MVTRSERYHAAFAVFSLAYLVLFPTLLFYTVG
jgi:hypothetical protein